MCIETTESGTANLDVLMLVQPWLDNMLESNMEITFPSDSLWALRERVGGTPALCWRTLHGVIVNIALGWETMGRREEGFFQRPSVAAYIYHIVPWRLNNIC